MKLRLRHGQGDFPPVWVTPSIMAFGFVMPPGWSNHWWELQLIGPSRGRGGEWSVWLAVLDGKDGDFQDGLDLSWHEEKEDAVRALLAAWKDLVRTHDARMVASWEHLG